MGQALAWTTPTDRIPRMFKELRFHHKPMTILTFRLKVIAVAIWTLLFGLSRGEVYGQNLADSSLSTSILPSVTIEEQAQAGGVISHLDSAALDRGLPSSLEPALQLLPGVRFEQRGMGGSRRLSIRGSLLRSPFGVRGVKLYWDGLPLTSPDGDTPLELLETAFLGSGRVMRGTQSTRFGPNSGGVVAFESIGLPEDNLTEGRLEAWGGSFGFYKLLGRVSIRDSASRNHLIAGYSRQNLEGYRQQESNQKHHFFLKGTHLADHDEYAAALSAYSGNWELPGALSDSMAIHAPRTALPYSVAFDAHVTRTWVRPTLHHRHQRKNWSLDHGLYGIWTEKKNPYGTSPSNQGYKSESAWGSGYRAEWVGFTQIRQGLLSLNLYGEFQWQKSLQFEYVNDSGHPGAPKRAENISTRSALMGAELSWAGRLGEINLAGSQNGLHYRVDDRFSADGVDYTQRLPMPSKSQWKAAFTKSWAVSPVTELTASLCAASGFSPPGLWEIIRDNGGINDGLKPENGFQSQFSMALSSTNNWNWQLEATLYRYVLRSPILPFTDSLGVNRFANGPDCVQQGIEVEWHGGSWSLGKRSKLNTQASFAYHSYRFKAETREFPDWNGKTMAGVPVTTVSGSATVSVANKLNFDMVYIRTGSIMVDLKTQTAQQAYHLLNAKAAWRFMTLGRKVNFKTKSNLMVCLGVNNLLGQSYSSFLNLNDARGRFWNPAPKTHFFAGLQLVI